MDQCTKGFYVDETVKHLYTRILEYLSGKPEPGERSLHTHMAEKSHFKVVRSSRFTRITEALVLATEKKICLLNDMTKSYKFKLSPFYLVACFLFFRFHFSLCSGGLRFFFMCVCFVFAQAFGICVQIFAQLFISLMCFIDVQMFP